VAIHQKPGVRSTGRLLSPSITMSAGSFHRNPNSSAESSGDPGRVLSDSSRTEVVPWYALEGRVVSSTSEKNQPVPSTLGYRALQWPGQRAFACALPRERYEL